MKTPIMLTGRQMAQARGLAGVSQKALADLAEVGLSTLARAEVDRDRIPGMTTTAMLRIVDALERAGVDFDLAGNISLRTRRAGD
jgi:DNA-binding transcriptional regulator YiaG